MNNEKIIANVLYAIGIVGGVESFTSKNNAIPIAVVALIVIIIASYLLEK